MKPGEEVNVDVFDADLLAKRNPFGTTIVIFKLDFNNVLGVIDAVVRWDQVSSPASLSAASTIVRSTMLKNCRPWRNS